jgi:hypothetical protein
LVRVVPCKVKWSNLNEAAVLRHEERIEQALPMHANHHVCLAAVHQISLEIPASSLTVGRHM